MASSAVRAIRNSFLFKVDVGNARVSVAQYAALSRQVPVLYLLLLVNAGALAFTHYGTAPFMLSVLVPGLLCGVCLIRLVLWLLRTQSVPSPDVVIEKMRKTVILAGVLSLGFGMWAISLYDYGDAYQQSHIAYFLSIAGISCVFCLMKLPPAALVTTGSLVVMLIGHFLFTGVPVFVAISVSIFLISFAFARITHTHFENFGNLVRMADMLEQKQLETERLNEANTKHAMEDQLTGLANRRKFFEQINHDLEASRGGKPPVIGLIDLDGFKPINDVFGHAAGDAVLVEASKRFRKLLPEDATIARIGGDEFGFILPNRYSCDEARATGMILCQALKDHFATPAGIAKLSGSCGIAVSSETGASVHRLLEQADFALYQAKSRHQGGIEVFSEHHVKLLEQRTSIERELQIADLRSELRLEFQPIIDLADGRTVCFEALGRWNNATLGEVSPGAFIPIAERCGMINDVSLILLRKAVDALAELPEDCRIAFNLSARDICNHVDSLKILSLIERSGVNPRRLEFEITETALLSNFDTAAKMIALFRTAGIKVALDDFGTGYSSLSHIHRLEFDKVKIDRSFVQQMGHDVRCRNIVKTVVDLCSNMGIDCVAEGVETKDVTMQLAIIGCSYGQGYYFARPMPLDAAVERAWACEAERQSFATAG
jgi:diguanylate cyclase (GGDEF)-like protein